MKYFISLSGGKHNPVVNGNLSLSESNDLHILKARIIYIGIALWLDHHVDEVLCRSDLLLSITVQLTGE